MIALLIVGGYLLGWIAAASAGMRVLADRTQACEQAYSGGYYRCDHLGFGHWRGDGEIGTREVIFGSLAGLLWPVLWLPVGAYLLANRRPTPRALENHIKRLEQEAGIR